MSDESLDSDLLLRIRRRDAAGLSTLYDRHANRLYAVARQVLGDVTLANEVLEALFLALWDGREQYDRHYGSPASWLIRSIRDRALSRQAQTVTRAVDPMMAPDARTLIEQAFYRGSGVEALAATYAISAEQVRTLLRDGIDDLKAKFAGGDIR